VKNWKNDRAWVAASRAALEAAEEADVVFVTTEFLELHPRFVPLEYSWGLQPAGRRVAWCCNKDDAYRLAPWVHEGRADRRECRWANGVFVVGGRVEWSRSPSFLSLRHWAVWRDKVHAHLNGIGDPVPVFRPAPGSSSVHGPRVLVVGATGMGNVGDDLLGYVLAQLLRRCAQARVWWCDSNVALSQLKQFDAVVVGGGGLVYASRDGRNETQNLANYLKFGPMCSELGLPVAMIGVSDQDHACGLDRDDATRAFVRACLPLFGRSTTRDPDSANLLQSLGMVDVRPGPDMLFGWTARARRAVRPVSNPPRLAMVGELMDYPHLVEALENPASPARAALAGLDIDLVLMSNDDVAHAQRIRPLLVRAGATATIHDFRSGSFETLVEGFSQYRGLVTTRFHGLVLAMMCNVPVLALDGSAGKKARLLRATAVDAGCLLTTDEPLAQGVARLAAAFAGDMGTVPVVRAQTLASRMVVHEQALGKLLEPWCTTDDVDAVDPDGQNNDTELVPLPPTERASSRYRTASLVRNERDGGGSVGLCWAASTRETGGYANLGDSLSAVLVAALSGRRVHHLNFGHPDAKLIAVGSIAHAIHDGEAVIWGSGVSVRGGELARNVPRTHYDVRAVRGPISARHLRGFGIAVPEIYGDPVWFLPSIFDEPVTKRYELGVIPHIQDIEGHGPRARPPADSLRYAISPDEASSVLIINTWHDPSWDGIRATLRAILSCKRIVSQSFHGVVIAEAYRIPVLHFRQMPGVNNRSVTVSLSRDCNTDPRIWEFYRGGPRDAYEMYAQRRDQRTDWQAVMRTIDERWEPFAYDASALAESFPMPLAYDPLSARIPDARRLGAIRF